MTNSCKVVLKNESMALQPNYAEEDIVCYKVIKRKLDGTPTSVYGHGDYPEIKRQTILSACPKAVKNNWFKRFLLNKPKYSYVEEGISWNEEFKWFDITFGFIHTLPHSHEGKMKHWFLIGDPPGHYECWKCIIPKGTKYYQANCRGSHAEYSDSYASKKIQFIKKVDEIDYKGWYCHTWDDEK